MPNEPESIAALFRRALQPRPDPLDVERREVQRIINRALEREAQREMRRMLRTLFARLVVGLAEHGWASGGAGVCAECAGDGPQYPLWSKGRPHYVTCPRGHRLHIECLRLREVDSTLGFEAACPRCVAA
jgi:hypothetical protein